MPVAKFQRTPGGEYSSMAPQATPAQMAYLRKLGWTSHAPMTKVQASARIDILKSTKR